MTDDTRLPGYDAVIPARVLYDQELQQIMGENFRPWEERYGG